MNSQLKSKIEHRFRLECATSTVLHVGAGRPGLMTDAELRRNSRGQIVIPGTAIAGTIRRTIERLAGVDVGDRRCQLHANRDDVSPCGCAVCGFLGNVSPGTGDSNRGTRRESKVQFFDAVINVSKTRIVDSVSIDRARRAASDAKKFDFAQVLPGALVTIEVGAENLSEPELKWLGAALRMLASGEVRVGGRTNRGHGKLEACRTACKIYSRNIASVDDLLTSVTHPASAPQVWHEVVPCLDEFPHPAIPGGLIVSFALRTDQHSSLLVADPTAAARTGFDRAMRRLMDSPELPVASLIGALRSGAERIVRTITSTAERIAPNAPTGTCTLFSSVARCEPPKDQKGRPLITDDSWCCLICRLFGNGDWASRLSADVRSVGDSHHELPMDHVAIDRFTGGASEHKKFDALALRDATFQVTLKIDLAPDYESSEWMIGLLALVIRDLNEGRITLGHGASKGHGFMQVADLNLSVPAGRNSAAEYLQGCVEVLWAKLGILKPAEEEAPRHE